MTEAEYWNNLRGEDYNAMFAGKYQAEHDAQEAWLISQVAKLPVVGVPPRVLEVGCGPGRLAKRLSGKCSYVGFDRSLTMSEPLRNLIDAGLSAEFTCWIQKRCLVDAAFTCSVLIHTPRDEAIDLVEKMCAVAERVWLIENKHVDIGFLGSHKISEEHGGCWLHNFFHLLLPSGWKIARAIELCRTHDVYILEKV